MSELSDFSAIIKGILDTSDVESKIKSLDNKYSINIRSGEFDTSGIEKKMREAGSSAGKVFSDSYRKNISSISTVSNNAENTIRHMQKTLTSLKFDSSSIDLVTKDLNQMNLEVKNVATSIRGNNLNIAIRGIDELGRAVTIVKQFDYQSGEISSVGKIIAQSFDTSSDAAKRFQKEVNQAYSDLIGKQGKIGSLQTKLARLNPTEDSHQIQEITAQIKNLSLEYNNLYSTFDGHFSKRQNEKLASGLDSIQNKVSLVNAKMADTSAVDKNTTAYKKLLDIIQQTKILASKRQGLDANKNKSEISAIDSELESLQTTYEKLWKEFDRDLNPTQFQNLHNETLNLKNELSILDAKSEDAKRKISEFINTKVGNGEIELSISKVEQKFASLKATVDSTGSSLNTETLHSKMSQIETDITTLNKLQTKLVSGDLSGEKLISTYENYNNMLLKVKNSLEIVSLSTKQYASVTEVATLENKMETWLKKNTNATAECKAEMQEYLNTLRRLKSEGSITTDALHGLALGYKKVDIATELAGRKGKSFTATIKGAFQSISKYVGVSTIVYEVFNALKNGIKDVVDLDTALVDLQKTAKASITELKEFYYSSNDMAKSLGVETKEVIQATADWSRLGYSLKDAQTMAGVSSIFASISPSMNIDVATDGLVSAMKAFDIEANDALDGIVSKINAIGNTQAVTNNDVVNFLTRSSSAMKEANNTLEETIALGTAATEITRDAEGVGNALKTISMRIRGYDEETEEFIGDMEVLEGEIADLTKTASKIGGVSLFKDSDKTEYKSTYELLRDISEIYDELSDKQQAQLLEKLAGKKQGQIVAAILNNFGAVENSLTTMANSAGSAMREMEVIEQSLEYKLNALKETSVGVFQNIFESDTIGLVINTLTKLLELIDLLTEHIGLLGTAFIGVSIYKFIKNFDWLNQSYHITQKMCWYTMGKELS